MSGRCACGKEKMEAGSLGWGGNYAGFAVEHTPDRCELQDHRTRRLRLCRWLAGVIDGLGGPYRDTALIRVWTRAEPSPFVGIAHASGQARTAPERCAKSASSPARAPSEAKP